MSGFDYTMPDGTKVSVGLEYETIGNFTLPKVEFKTPEPDTTFKLIVSCSGDDSAISKANDYLSKMRDAIANGDPYEEEFEFIKPHKDVDGITELPLRSFDREIEIPKLSREAFWFVVDIFLITKKAVPEIGISGYGEWINEDFRGWKDHWDISFPIGDYENGSMEQHVLGY